MCCRVLPALFIFALTSSFCRAGDACEVLYVAKGHVNPANDGSSWASAFCNDTALADGIAAAAARMADVDAPPCIDIYVAAGVYKPSDSSASFAMHDKVHLYGGFKVGDDFSMRQTGCIGGENDTRPCETADDCLGGTCDLERVTIISGDINDDDGAECTFDADCGGTNQCVRGQCAITPNFGPLVTYDQAGACTLDGFVLLSAYASLGSAVRIVGQANLCPPMGPTLRNCIVRKNYTGAGIGDGGAVSNDYAGTIIDHCLFSDNEAYDLGGALRSIANHSRVIDSVFVNNRANGLGRIGGVVAVKPFNTPDCPGAAINTFEGCDFTGNSATSLYGTGALATGAVVLSRCMFRGNYGHGVGAVALGGAGQATIDACDFVDNISAMVGAIESYGNSTVRNSTFNRNIGEIAGAMYLDYGNTVVEGCKFFNNAGDYAGAIHLVSIGTVRDTIFAGNRWLGGNYVVAGAAIFLDADGDEDELTCERCRFFGNSGAEGTVTVFQSTVTLVDSLFAGNASPVLSLRVENADANLVQCTLASNSASTGFGSINTTFVNAAKCGVKVSNSVIWGNRDDDSSLECTDQIDCGQGCDCASCAANSPCFECSPLVTTEVSHSDIEHPSCVWPGAGNINEDPMFVRNDMPRDCDGNGWGDPQCAAGPCMPGVTGCDDYGDFRLRPGSPAINAGDPNAEDLPETDLDGNPRVIGCPDMGAYEFVAGGDCCVDEDCGETEVCCANACAPDIDTDDDTVADCRDLCPGEDDRIDADQNGIPDCAQFTAIPTVSTWGLVILALMLLVVAKARLRPQGARS